MSERFSFAPTPDKLIPEEADDPKVRASADLFVGQLYHQMDPSEYGPNALIPTPQGVQQIFEGLGGSGLFSLTDAYGAAKRRLLYDKELVAKNIEVRKSITNGIYGKILYACICN